MSALPIPNFMLAEPTKYPPAPRGVLFISAREAAYRSGWAMETIAGRCRREWVENGLAFLAHPTGGGKATWHIREDADRAFARSKSPDAMPFDERDYTARQRETIARRKELLDAWLEARGEAIAIDGGQNERQVTESFVARCKLSGERVSRPTLFRWMTDYAARGKAGLCDARAKSPTVSADRKWFESQLERFYLQPGTRWTMRLVYYHAVLMANDLNRPVPYGYKQASRFLSALDPKMVALRREGPRVFDAKYGSYTRRDHSSIASNDLWMSDGHKFDCMVYYQGKATRPILISWMDIASRMIVGYTIEPKGETADAIRLALKRGVEAWGTPRQVYIDNGAAYDAKHIQGITKARRRAGERPSIDEGIFPRLNIEVTHARPHNAKAKGEIERFHRTICQRFTCMLPGYMGGDPLNKPHTYATEVKAGKLLSFDEFCERFHDWLSVDYHHRAHTGDGMNGMTPAAVFAERMREKRALPADKIELELCRRVPVTVGRNGVSVKLHGATLCYEHVALNSIMGTEVQVVLDDDRLDRVGVYRLDGSRLCVADAVAAVPVNATPEQLREAMKSRKRDRTAVAKGNEAKLRIHDDPFERMHRLAIEAEGNSPVPMPDVIQPVRTRGEHPPLRIAGADEGYVDELDDYERYANVESRRAVMP